MDPVLRAILTILVIGLIVGVILYFVPLPYPFGTIILAVAVIGAIVYAARAFGVFALFVAATLACSAGPWA